MTYATDPQLQPADSGPMLSPDDYHWAEKRGEITGRSLMYSLASTLLLLGITSPSRRSWQVPSTFSSAASYPSTIPACSTVRAQTGINSNTAGTPRST